MQRAASLSRRPSGRLPVVGASSSAGRPQPRAPAKTASARGAPRARLVLAAASASNGGGEPSNNNNQPDIDALAAMLSARAAEMRASMDSLDDPALLEEEEDEPNAAASAPAPPPPPPPPLPFDNNDPAQVAAAEARVLSAVGEGGFQGADFALVQQLGRLSVGRSTTRGGGDGSGGPSSSSSSSSSSVAAVAYAARFEPGVPYQQPAPVLLKEYLQRPLALNELLAVARLQEVEDREDWEEQAANANDDTASIEAAARRNRPILPPASAKWRAATAPPRPGEPPIVPLLGYFESPPSASAREALGLPPIRPEDEDEEDEEAAARNAAAAGQTFWLVYRWEGMRPLSWFLDSAEPLPLPAMRVAEKRLRAAARRRRQGDDDDNQAAPKQPQNNNFFARALRALRRAGPTRAEAALAKRAAFLRAAAAGSLAALAHCHGRGVAHGSLGSGCVMVSSAADDALAAVAEEASSSGGGASPFKPQAVRVKLDNFGLATVGASRGGGGGGGNSGSGGGGDGEESRLAEARVTDLQALGATLAEAFVVGMSCYGGGGGDWDEDEEDDEEGDGKNNSKQQRRAERPPPPPPARGAALQRLLFQLYGPDDKIRADPAGQDEDRSTLRAYLLQEPSGAYAPLVSFLDEDEGSGWALLAALVAGNTPAALLLSLHARWLKGAGDGGAAGPASSG